MSLAPSTLRRLMRELSQLASNPPEGIALSKESMASLSGEEIDGYGTDLSNIRAWVAGPPGTPFEGGYFKIRFSFGDDFPAAPPKCTFQTKIFHPNVDFSSGAICVSALKKDWQPSFGISHILLVIKCLLIHPNPASALHAEAGRLFQEAFEDYAARARLMTSIHSSASAPTSTKSSGATPLGDSNSNAANSMERSGSTGSLSGSPKKRSVGEVVGEGVGTVSKVAAGGAPAAKKVEKAPVKKRGLKRL